MTDEGKKYAAEGSPEVQLFLAVPEEGSISKDELQVITMDMYMYNIWWDLLVMLNNGRTISEKASSFGLQDRLFTSWEKQVGGDGKASLEEGNARLFCNGFSMFWFVILFYSCLLSPFLDVWYCV